MRVDCSKLFDKPRLLLLVWERLNDTVHIEVLKLLRDLMGNINHQSRVMPLLRPAGRDPINYSNPSCPKKLWCGGFKDETGILPSGVLSELWIHTTVDVEASVWQKIETWIGKSNFGRAWRDIGQAPDNIWQPLCDRLERCQYLTCHFQGGEIRWCQVPKEQIPWALKVIWYRSTEVIYEKLLQSSQPRLLDPLTEKDFIADLLNEILGDLELINYGIADTGGPIDPSRFCISHMAAFALNAVTQIAAQPVYKLEDYFQGLGEKATRPSYFPDFSSREKFVEAIRSA